MKALRKLQRGPGNVEVVEIPSPAPKEGEVLVEVKYAGICGTDIHILHDLYPKARPPVTLGHEFCGVVTQLGPQVTGWRTGDRVTVDTAASFCGLCQFCKAGQTQLCNQRVGYGSSTDGGFASLVTVREGALHRLPDHLSFQEGAICEPLACAAHAVMEVSSVVPGIWVLITGPGTIGLCALQVAKAMRAKVIITGTQRDEERLKVAERLGADHCLQINPQDSLPFISQLTGGDGADIAFECSGNANAVKDCLAALRKGGEMIQVGLFGHPILSNYDDIVLKEIHLKGTFGHNRGNWVKAINLLETRKVNLQLLVSGEFPLSRWPEGFRLFEKGAGLKYLLYPIKQ
ncbi:MAG: zinc-binding dehydrogenase [Proteobacteria bacterium]|nr:zinc-binding dehydrogenase [Pseudomonadota bacterium]